MQFRAMDRFHRWRLPEVVCARQFLGSMLLPLRGPGRAHRSGTQLIGFGVVDEFLFDWVVLQVSLQPHADVGGVHRGHGAVHRLGIGHGRAARLDAVEEVAGVVQRPLRAGRVLVEHSLDFAQQRRRGSTRLRRVPPPEFAIQPSVPSNRWPE